MLHHMIERTRIGNVEPGQFICAVDDDDLEDPNTSYDAEDQEWVCVVRLQGHADVGQVITTLDGTTTTTTACSWDQYTWRLLANGKPVVDYSVAGEAR